ncbi:MAG: DMT family transporter [Hyphomicrobiales bacterium]|jgi:drug/metabolite transporter (DMT)-like permease|nr:DMT family transporter [Hyphomicrobiales bacterium]
MIGTLPFLAIMASALLHAVWNALARSHKNPGDIMVSAVMASGLMSIPLLLVTGLPPRAAMPWLVGGVVINSIGIRAAMIAYTRTSYGLAYPIMRAGIPLLALPTAILLFNEWPTAGGAVGVLLISCALILLALIASRSGKAELSGVGYALLAALCGAGYVTSDAMGVRLSPLIWSYAGAVSLGNGLVLALMMRLEGRNPAKLLAANSARAFFVASISTSSFFLYVWALNVTPVALAAALRETSVLFATAIAAFVLKEKITTLHWCAASLALAGIVSIRMF